MFLERSCLHLFPLCSIDSIYQAPRVNRSVLRHSCWLMGLRGFLWIDVQSTTSHCSWSSVSQCWIQILAGVCTQHPSPAAGPAGLPQCLSVWLRQLRPQCCHRINWHVQSGRELLTQQAGAQAKQLLSTAELMRLDFLKIYVLHGRIIPCMGWSS